jgi:hypothetical protein
LIVSPSTKFAEKKHQEVTIQDALSESMKELRRESALKNAEILAHRIRHLAPYSERNIVYALGLRFSQCLQEISRATAALENELSRRFSVDCENDIDNPLVQQLRAISHSLKSGRGDWAEMQSSLGLGRLASPKPLKVQDIIDDIRERLSPCRIFKEADFQDSGVEDETIISFGNEVNAILSEMILGGLADLESHPEGYVLRLSSQAEGNWVEVTLRDNLTSLSPEEVARINDGVGVPLGEHFGRAWGLSVMQHVAVQGGGRLTVETIGGGNTIRYRIPRAHA